MEDSGIDTADNEKSKDFSERGNAEYLDNIPSNTRASSNRTRFIDSDSELSDEEWIPPKRNSGPKAVTSHINAETSETINDMTDEDFESLLTGQSKLTIGSANAKSEQPMLRQPQPNNRIVRHDHTDLQPGMLGRREASGLLVDVPMDETDSDEDIPLSWQRANRSMRDQLLKDGYNLDLESDNEDLDLIPPKPQSSYSGLGGLCSCSSEACVIS